jgi:hypothetical protein
MNKDDVQKIDTNIVGLEIAVSAYVVKGKVRLEY